jgi:hypothetical protein
MDPVTYLTTPTSGFGGLAWAFLIAEGLGLLAGVYLAFLRSDTHPIRGGALRNLGFALLALGGLGVLFGALRLGAVAPFTMPIWFYLIALVDLALAAYVLYYWQVRYAAHMSAYQERARSSAGRRAARPQPTLETTGNGAIYSAPRPVATTGRREARRDRKRRGR